MSQLYVTVDASRAITAADFNKTLIAATALTMTLDEDRKMGLSANNDTTLTLYRQGAGVVAFAAGPNVTIANNAPNHAQYGLVSIQHVGPNTWAYVQTADTATYATDSNGNVTGLVGPDGRTIVQMDNQYALRKYPILSTFSSLAEWTKVAATPSIVDISASTDSGGLGTGSLRFASITGSGNAYIGQDKTFNLSATSGVWLAWTGKYKQTASQVGLTAYMSHSTALASGIGRVSTASELNTVGFGKQSEWIANSDWATLDGTPNFANDWLSWRFRIDAGAGEPHDFVLDGVLARNTQSKPQIIISFDDGWATSYTVGHAEAAKRDIQLTHYLIGSTFGTGGFITTAQAQLMKDRGDYLGVHGANPWYPNVATNCAADIEALRALGFIDLNHASWPEGNFGTGTEPEASIASAKALGLKTIRQIGSSSSSVFLPGYVELGAIPGFPLNNSRTLAQAKAAIDTAITSGGSLIFYAHKIAGAADSLTWVTADYINLLDYIVQKRLIGSIDVTTIDKFYDSIAGNLG